MYKMLDSSKFKERIIEKAQKLGASIAGITCLDALKNSPSYELYSKINKCSEANSDIRQKGDVADKNKWPSDAVSIVIIGVEHNINNPELDWWDGKGTPGNRLLIKITKELSEWINHTFSVRTYQLPYFVEKGGIFLKDAAVLAGLGCIGKNNLVITPEYGPRIRFRAILLNCEVEPANPIDFNPCDDCHQPCRKSCPEKVFQNDLYSGNASGQVLLPGTDGTYDRTTCNIKMQKDIEDALKAIYTNEKDYNVIQQHINEFEDSNIMPKPGNKLSNFWVKYCRRCELSCMVGQ